MYETQKAAALSCLRAAEQNCMTFPQILCLLSEAGFEGYTIDFRQGTACYVLPSGEHVSFACPVRPVAPTLDVPGLQSAIRAAQAGGADYTYDGFCNRAAAAGCAAYVVSLTGRRVLYYGRTAEAHVEYFPPAA